MENKMKIFFLEVLECEALENFVFGASKL